MGKRAQRLGHSACSKNEEVPLAVCKEAAVQRGGAHACLQFAASMPTRADARLFHRPFQDNACINVIDVDVYDGTLEVVAINLVSHLPTDAPACRF